MTSRLDPSPPESLLSAIDFPAQLRELPESDLPQLCAELRDYIIDAVSVHGGHFGASLGAVELTVAAHYVYNTPRDLLVWDVGHQAYGHKILTGRRPLFATNRKFGGISGFPRRDESEYDAFGVAHASTSISAALGMAIARDLSESDRKIIAVIGDGALTGGLAFEGLNNAGVSGSDMVVVLNDNRMSIDPNVGALNEYLAEISSGKRWNQFRDDIWELFEKLKGKGGGTLQRLAARIEDGLKAAITPGGLFEALGFRYFGPVDGHDVELLVSLLRDLRNLKGPILLHAVTMKGKGFAPAEADQVKWHAQSSPFDKITGLSLAAESPFAGSRPPKWQDVFGKTLVELAHQDERIAGITAAMPSGTSMKFMLEALPQRAFDVGIAEMHAVVFAAGLATQGYKPFVAIYSSFLQRAYDGIVHDVALQHLPVVFCLDRSGLAGSDGPTHHGALDIAYLRCVPGLVCAAPLDEQDLRDLMYTASLHEDGPFVIRYPRGEALGVPVRLEYQRLPVGKGRQIRDGRDLAFLSYGAIGSYLYDVCDRLAAAGIEAAHYDLRYAKPLDGELLSDVFQRFSRVITIEDGVVMGGVGSAVLEWMADHGCAARLLRLGLPDEFVPHGEQIELHEAVGIGPDGIYASALRFVEQEQIAEPGVPQWTVNR
jgi:1-deoxy-D-xylulose-5-phosphate synthase